MTKKILLLIVTFIASYNLLFSQTLAADSLRALLKAHHLQDTTRVNMLNDLGREIRRANPKQADSLTDLAISLSNQLNYTRGKGNALAIKGASYSNMMDHEAAKKAFAESKQLLESAGDKAGEAFLMRMQANLFMDEGDYAKALDDFLHGLKLAQQAGDINK